MGLTGREQQVLNEIKQWEKQLHIGMLSDFTGIYDKWLDMAMNRLPIDTKENFFLKLDNWLFHFHAFILNSETQLDSRKQILSSARVFDETIQQIEELTRLSVDKLTYIADNQIAKHRLASIVQGSLTGTGNSLFISTDLIALAVINMRVIQLIALSFGFDTKSPLEMMVSLKLFYIATLPKRYQKYGWDMLLDELDDNESLYFYAGIEKIADEKWIEEPAKQVVKSLFLFFTRKKVLHRIPIVGVAIGGGMNYILTRHVTVFAEKFYQYRYLLKKQGALS